MVPPGNWCEIFSVVAAWAVPVPKRRAAGAASADAMTWRRVSMVYPPAIGYWVGDRDRPGPIFAGLRSELLWSDRSRRCDRSRRRATASPDSSPRPKLDTAAPYAREQPFAEDSVNNTSNPGTR